MTRPGLPMDPQPPVKLPEKVLHGTATAHQPPYRCRCEDCLEWRRDYDRRYRARRAGKPAPRIDDVGREYVCVGLHAITYAAHVRVNGVCVNCKGRYDYGDDDEVPDTGPGSPAPGHGGAGGPVRGE